MPILPNTIFTFVRRLPRFLQYIGRTTPTIQALCTEAFWQTGVVHATHMAEPSQAVPLYPLPNSGMFLAAVADNIIA